MIPVLMDNQAQILFLNAMISSPELFARVNGILQPDYFDASLQGSIKFLKDYFQENRAVPGPQIFHAATKVAPEVFEIPRQDVQFLAEQIASFCQASAMINILRKGPGFLEKRDYGGMIEQFKAASQIGLLEDLGIEYFVDPEARLSRLENEDKLISTGWKDVDRLLDGGVGRQELINFLSPSGGGKSLNMMNLAYNLLEQGLHGVYVSIEMKDTKVALRADQMIARMRSGMIKQSVTKVAHEIQLFGERTGARFFIKRMREGVTNANHVSAYLKELEATKAFKPDFVVVDYLDIMQPVRKVTGENMFLKDQYVTEEVRGIGFDYDCIMISGTQLAKSATEMIEEGKTMHQGLTQGGASKTNTSDVMIAAVRSNAMKEQGLYRFEFIKSRNADAVGKSCEMKFNSESLRVTDGSAPVLELKKKRPGLQMSDVKPGQAKQTLGGLAGDS